MSLIRQKQIQAPDGSTFDAVTEGQSVGPSAAAELIAGKDDTDTAHIIATDADGAVKVSVVNDITASLEGGTSSAPLYVTAASAVPVSLSNTSGSAIYVTVTNPGGGGGDASESTLATRLADATFTARIPTLGAKASAGSVSITPATDATFPVTGTVSVSNFPATQPVSATSLPLPTGAATETTLAALNTKTPSLGQATKAGSQPVTLASDQGNLPVSVQNASLAVTGTFWQATQPVSIAATVPVSGTFFQATQPVSATSLPLPTGAATETTLGTRLADATFTTRIPTLGAKTGAGSVSVVPATDASFPVTGSVSVSNFPSSQAVTGTFFQATQPVSAASLPLPTGAATAAKQPALGTAGTASADVLTIQGIASMTAIKVDGSAVTQPVSGTFWQATQPVSLASQPLPTGAATETTLASRLAEATFTTRIPTLGAKASAGSVSITPATDATFPVSGSVSVSNFPSSQAVTGTFWQATQPVSAASLPLPTGASTETTLGTRLADSTFTGRIPTLGAKAGTGSVSIVPATDAVFPISGTVTATNASTGTVGSAVVSSATEIGVSDGTNLRVPRAFDTDSGAGTEYVLGTVLRATSSGGSVEAGTSTNPLRTDPTGTTTQPVSGSVSVSNFPATQPVSATALPLPTGAATETTLSAINTKTLAAGQATMAASSPVVIASNQSALPVTLTSTTVTGTVAVTDNSGSLTVDSAQLPTTLGAKTIANALAVSIASDQTVPVSGTVTITPSGTQTVSGSVSVSNFPATQPVSIASSVAVTGTFWQATQPVSGTVTANIGTTNGLALDATLTGGTQRTKLTDGTTNAAVKAASTAAVAVDPALVVAISPNNTVGVTGTFFQATQPISATALPLPTGAATETTLGTRLADSTFTTRIPTLGAKAGTGSVSIVPATDASFAVTGAFFQATQPVSATSLPLPTGAATSAKQPALGTAGTPSTDVLTVQGAASMTAIKVDGSAVTQPVSGTFWQTTQPVSGTVSITGSVPVTQSGTWTTQIGASGQGGTAATGLWTRLGDPVNAVAAAVKATTPSGSDNALAVMLTPNSASLAVTSSTFATNATLTGGTQTSKVTDGTNTAAVKAASTAPLATDPALVVSISPNSTLTTSNPSIGTTGSAVPASATLVGGTDGTNTRALAVSSLGVLSVANTTPDIVNNGTIAASGNTVALATAGYTTVGMTITAGTFIGTLVPEVSFDGGTSWASTFFDDPITGQKSATLTFASSNTLTMRTIVGAGGSSNTRVRVSAFTSGSANLALRGSMRADPSVLYTGPAGGLTPPTTAQMGGSDGTNIRALSVSSGGVLNVAVGNTVGVTGTFWQATQPVSIASSVPVTGTFWQATQPVSGTVAITSTTAQAITAVQGSPSTAANAWPTKISDGTSVTAVKAASTAAVATDPALVVAISPNNTVPVSIAGTVAVSSATLATQATLASILSNTPAVGQTTMAASSPVVIASNQSSIPVTLASTTVTGTVAVSGTFWQATQPVSGTTTANQGTANTIANAWPSKITDGTNTATVRGPSSNATATDSSLVVQVSPNSALYVRQAEAATVGNAWPTLVTDGTRTATVKAASTAAVAADPALVVAISPNNPVTTSVSDVTASGTLSSGASTVAINVAGRQGVSAYFPASGAVALTAQVEYTNSGGLWSATYFQDTISMSTSYTLTVVSLTGYQRLIVVPAGATQIRVSVQSYTSGSIGVNLAATTASFNLPFHAGIAGTPVQLATSQVGGSDGTNLRPLSVTTAGVLKTDGSATTQPVSIAGTVAVSSATLATQTTLASIDTKTLAAGQATMAASSPVVIASNQSALPVTLTSTTITGTVAVTSTSAQAITAVQGPANSAANGWFTKITDGTNTATVKAGASVPSATVDSALVVTLRPDNNFNVNSINNTVAVSSTTLASAANQTNGTQTTRITDAGGATATVKSGSSAAATTDPSLVVQISPLNNGTTPTVTGIGAITTSTAVQLFAANTIARGRVIWNNSTVSLYVKFGATAAATSFTIVIPPSAGYVFDWPMYTGVVTAVTVSGATTANQVMATETTV